MPQTNVFSKEAVFLELHNNVIPQLVRKFRSYLYAKYGECDLPAALATEDLSYFSALVDNFDVEEAIGTEMFADIGRMQFVLGRDWKLNVNIEPTHDINSIQLDFQIERDHD